MFSFGLSSVTAKVSVANSGYVFDYWKRYRITIDVLQILEKPYPANKYLQSTKEILKQDVKSAIS